jgi:hypothetical protein
MWLGVGASAIAVIAVLLLREIPLRRTTGAPAPSAAADGRRPAVPAAD